ncbi:MAG: sugar phosphate isomerase/epimerase [Phycisphaerales bacterium]|nr:sugar phosphate isomerase/epimerase [Phycisphaerales bacterium]
MPIEISRRSVLQSLLAIAAGSASKPTSAQSPIADAAQASEPRADKPNRISLAQWSLHKMLKAGGLDPLDFPAFARSTFGVVGVEYVNQFYHALPVEGSWVLELKKRAGDAGVESLLIMCDGVGEIGDPDAQARGKAVEAHKRWLDAAAALGCHAIRVNARSEGTDAQQMAHCADGLRQLCVLAEPLKLAVLVENHGGISCDGAWVASLIRATGATNCGTLPDFGNFHRADGTMDDRYAGVAAMMPFARAVSAKSNDFDSRGEETATDYARMLGIVRSAGYRGWIGVEYEGVILGEVAGTKATRDLLLKLGCTL